MYRRQVDQVQYNSLPRQSFPTLVQHGNNGSAGVDLDAPPSSQQTTPKQRTVAFGKGFLANSSSTSYSTPTINDAVRFEKGEGGGGVRATAAGATTATELTNNIYHHQLVLGQPLGQLKGFEKQRGYSVPNLGAIELPTYFNFVLIFLFLLWRMFLSLKLIDI